MRSGRWAALRSRAAAGVDRRMGMFGPLLYGFGRGGCWIDWMVRREWGWEKGERGKKVRGSWARLDESGGGLGGMLVSSVRTMSGG